MRDCLILPNDFVCVCFLFYKFRISNFAERTQGPDDSGNSLFVSLSHKLLNPNLFLRGLCDFNFPTGILHVLLLDCGLRTWF